MKILRITSIGYEGGGADNGIILLQPVLEKMGHEVKILTSNLHPELPHFSDFEFEAFDNQPKILQFIYRAFNFNSFYVLKKILKEYKPDIIQLHTMSEVSPSVLFLLKSYPTVLTVHGAEDFVPDLLLWSFPSNLFKSNFGLKKGLNFKGWIHYLLHKYINGSIYSLGLQNVDTFIVFSKYMKNHLAKESIKSVCVRNATQLFDYIPINSNSRIILYAGRLEKSKGVQILISAMPRILKSFPDTKLFIGGSGAYEGELRALVIKFNIQNHVEFLGQKNRNELYKLYEISSIILVPSLWPEPFGKVGIEAMSVGRPVIASNVGGIPEWQIDGKTGYLVPSGDSNIIAEKVVNLFSNPHLLKEMSLNARIQSENFTIEEHAKKIITLYKEVISRYKKWEIEK